MVGVAMKVSPCGVRNATRQRTAVRSVESGIEEIITRSVMEGGRKRGRWQRQRDARMQPVTLRETVDLNQLKHLKKPYQRTVEVYQKGVISQLGMHRRRRL